MCDNHDHGHCHEGHSHDHHSHGQAHSPEETVALLTYMIDHNKHHGEDLHEIYHALADSGKAEAAELLHKAMHLYEDGNALLADALKMIGGK